MNLYITADKIGTESGGGKVTRYELEALHEVGYTRAFSGPLDAQDPYQQDRIFHQHVVDFFEHCDGVVTLVHCYAGCLSETVAFLNQHNVKVTYTAAAHDIAKSRQEHEKLGAPFPFPHLTNPELWKKYIQGYLLADVVITPSTHSANVMQSYGCKNIKIIPHGVDIPEEVKPLPEKFTVGYLGAIGPDKGLIYLLQAWKNLNYQDATLIFAGPQTTNPWFIGLIESLGLANVKLLGWVSSPSELYNQCSLYVQPSITEGFGCEVLEAMAHGRLVICSDGAGASDVLPEFLKFKAGDVFDLANHINAGKQCFDNHEGLLDRYGMLCREASKDYLWSKIKQSYIDLWKGLL